MRRRRQSSRRPWRAASCLTKTDLISASDRRTLEHRLRAINPATPIVPVVNGQVDPAILFDAGSYDPATKTSDVQRWLKAESYDDASSHDHRGRDHQGHGHHHGHDHHGHGHDVNRHDDRIHATCLTIDEPLDPHAFERWLDILIMFKGADILRVKGIVNLAGEPRPFVIYGVQHIFHPPVRLDAWPSEDRRTRLVLITRDVSANELRGTLTLLTTGMEQYGLQGYVEDLLNERIPVMPSELSNR